MYLYRLGDLEDRGGRLRAPIPVCVGGDDIELTDRFQCQRGSEGIVHHPKILGQMPHDVLCRFLTLTCNEGLKELETMWTQLTRADVERAKQDLQARRSEMLVRHAGELTALDVDEAELTVLEQAIDDLVRKFGIGSAEIVTLKSA
jgi:hypothetical protein